MHILVINGPNLNLLGTREVNIYGTQTYESLERHITQIAESLDMRVTIHQTNFEGIVLDLMHHAHKERVDAILINPGAFTHYSYAIYDAIKGITIPVVEVHLSDVSKREEAFRKINVVRPAVKAHFQGKGFTSYEEAIRYIKKEWS